MTAGAPRLWLEWGTVSAIRWHLVTQIRGFQVCSPVLLVGLISAQNFQRINEKKPYQTSLTVSSEPRRWPALLRGLLLPTHVVAFAGQRPDPAAPLPKLRPSEGTVKSALGDLGFRSPTRAPAVLAAPAWGGVCHSWRGRSQPGVRRAHKHVLNSRNFVHCISTKSPNLWPWAPWRPHPHHSPKLFCTRDYITAGRLSVFYFPPLIPVSLFLPSSHFQLTFSLPMPANLHTYSCLHFVSFQWPNFSVWVTLRLILIFFFIIIFLHYKIKGARSFANALNYSNGKKRSWNYKVCWNKPSVKSCSVGIKDNISNYVSIYYFPALTFLQVKRIFVFLLLRKAFLLFYERKKYWWVERL